MASSQSLALSVDFQNPLNLYADNALFAARDFSTETSKFLEWKFFFNSGPSSLLKK